jgi:3-dehydroquinate synthase
MAGGPVTVTHALGSYPVFVEPGGLSRLEELVRRYLPGRRIAMIADANVDQLYRTGRLGASWTVETLTVPAGEQSKNRDSWARLTDQLLERRFGRDSAVIAMGGGVVGDLAGFVAATYMRGVPYFQVPTTLLAMLDASVGGKTGVDTPQGKNLVGAFHPPAAVLADPLVLNTLPERDYHAGLAEAVKHGLIADRAYFEWMEAEAPAVTSRDPSAVTRLIRRSVEIKAEVVSADERESGRRAILNAGHTIAHALEQASNYQLPHGEAVALGLVAECEMAERLGIAPAGVRARVAALLQRFGLPQRAAGRFHSSQVLGTMMSDKKNRDGQVHFALPAEVGRMHQGQGWTIPVSAPVIEAALDGVQ